MDDTDGDFDGDITQDELLDFVDRLIDNHPWQIFITAMTGAVMLLAAMGLLIWAISRSGKYSPPVVVVTIVLGVVTVLSLIALMVRPEIQALAVAVGSGIGGLAGAITLAMERHHADKDTRQARDSATLTKIMPHLRDDEDERATYGTPPESVMDQARRAVQETVNDGESSDEQSGQSEGDSGVGGSGAGVADSAAGDDHLADGGDGDPGGRADRSG